MTDTAVTVVSGGPRKVVKAGKRAALNKVPDDILNDPELRLAMEVFPDNYNLEIPKTIWRIRRDHFKMVALQLPEGLTMFATSLRKHSVTHYFSSLYPSFREQGFTNRFLLSQARRIECLLPQ